MIKRSIGEGLTSFEGNTVIHQKVRNGHLSQTFRRLSSQCNNQNKTNKLFDSDHDNTLDEEILDTICGDTIG